MKVNSVVSGRLNIQTEGLSDENAVKQIIRILGVSAKVTNARGRNRLLAKLDGYVNFHSPDCDRLIVLMDSNCNDPEVVKTRALSRLQSGTPRPDICIAITELESWFLADPEAIEKGMGLSRINCPGNPEEIHDAKEKLDEITSRKYKPYRATSHAPLIARHLDIEKVGEVCPSFKEFVDILTDC